MNGYTVAINFFITDGDNLRLDDKRVAGYTYEITDPPADEEVPYTACMSFSFTAPGNDPNLVALQLISYRFMGGVYTYTYHGEVTGADLTVSPTSVIRVPLHHSYSGVLTWAVGGDPYVILNLCRVEGSKRRVRGTRNLLA